MNDKERAEELLAALSAMVERPARPRRTLVRGAPSHTILSEPGLDVWTKGEVIVVNIEGGYATFDADEADELAEAIWDAARIARGGDAR